jgi:4-amino-4-deoxy-L-arabinose transferase-like glycosyltransferase
MKSIAPATLLLLSALFLIPGLGGKNSPGQGDEVMHLLTVQGSLAAGSYLVPVLEGQPNYYKPPLLFWMAMGTEKIFGGGLFGGRISSVVFTAASALVIYFILLYGRVDWRIAFASALAYILTVGAMKFARLLMMEQAMAFALLLVVLCLMAQIQTGKLRYALFAGLITGAAFLFKGPLFIVYTGLIYSVWIMIPLFRFEAENGWRWSGGRHIPLALKTAVLVLAGSFVLPLLWIGSVLAFTGQGGAVLLEFFFVVENFGKFAQENQNTLRLLGGWLTYTFPWTLIVLAGMFLVFVPQRMQSRRQYFGRILILSVFTLMIFHVLPHRKAAYYGVPFMPLVFAGIPLLLKDLRALERPARWTLILLYFVSPVLALAALLASESWLGLLLLVPALAALFLNNTRIAQITERLRLHKSLKIAGFSGALMILSLQFVLYPLVNHEVIPTDRVQALARNICVVTGETWDAMDLKVLRPDIDVIATVPMSPETCVDGRRAVLHIPDAPREESMIDLALEGKKYQEKFRWNMWSRRLDANAVLDYLQGGRRILSRVRYYESVQ